MRRIGGTTRILLVVAFAGLLLLTFRPRWTPGIEGPNAIAVLEEVTLGGVPQSILVRGVDVNQPVLLWLHGGPGGTVIPVAHVFGRELEKHFVVVHWDQRGSGLSERSTISDESLNLEQFLSDTHELIEILRSRFDADRIFLLGHSWGSALGLITAQRHPEMLHAYIGMGQVTNEKRSEELGLQWVRQRARQFGNEQALRELDELKPPYLDDPRKIVIQRKWLSRFGGQVHEGRPFLFWEDVDRTWAMLALRSPEYSWFDLLRFLRANSRVRWALFPEFKQIDFMRTAPRIEIPVFFLMGRHDYNMQPILVEEYYNLLDAPKGKSLIWFEDSAHSPCLEEPVRFGEVMVRRVLAEALAAQQGAAADVAQRVPIAVW